MRPVLLSALALAQVFAAGCSGQAAGADKFDLVCRGQMTRNGAPQPFETRLHVDLASKRFCEGVCLEVFHLTEASANQLSYRYDVTVADADHAAGRFRGAMASSAGPFPLSEEISFDRRTGAYRRAYRYQQGDPAARDYDDRYVGQCRTMPFTGLAARAG
jgi:hypothetical protein